MSYREIRRATVWSYELHRRMDGRVAPEGTRPYEKLPIPTDLAIVHITLLVVGQWVCQAAYPHGGLRGFRSFHMKRESNQNVSGNEVYFTNSLILLAKNMLCSKLHRQQSFNLILFSRKI